MVNVDNNFAKIITAKIYSTVKTAQDIRFPKNYRKLRKSGRPLKKYIFSAIFHRLSFVITNFTCLICPI